jgi:transposase
LGGISKRGDVYLRTLLVNGARAVLQRAQVLKQAGKPLDRLRDWALETEARAGYNKATIAVANKLAIALSGQHGNMNGPSMETGA